MSPAVNRPTPPGCCPGCLQSYESEPCPLHCAAADLEAACLTGADIATAIAEGKVLATSIDWARVAADLRAAIAKAGGAR